MSKLTTLDHLKEAVSKLQTLVGTLATSTTEAIEEVADAAAAAQETADANAYTHPGVTAADTTSTVTPDYGGTVSVVDSVTRDSSGHVTGVNTKTVTLPTASLTASCDSDTEELALEANCLTVGYSDEELALTAV